MCCFLLFDSHFICGWEAKNWNEWTENLYSNLFRMESNRANKIWIGSAKNQNDSIKSSHDIKFEFKWVFDSITDTLTHLLNHSYSYKNRCVQLSFVVMANVVLSKGIKWHMQQIINVSAHWDKRHPATIQCFDSTAMVASAKRTRLCQRWNVCEDQYNKINLINK